MSYAEIVFYPKNSKSISLKCEVAKNYTSKIKGLMNKEHLPKNEGMIFTFLFSWHKFFWMKNVKIPLDIIFISRKLEIIKIYEAPLEKGPFYKLYWSHGLCKYVIETNIGFSKKNNIQVKNRIKIKKKEGYI